MRKKSKAITTIQVAIIAAIIMIAVVGAEAWYFLSRPAPTLEVEQKLVIGTTDTIDGLDPHSSTAWLTGPLNHLLYDSLLSYNVKTLEVEPGLAESYTVSSDGLTLTFKLRKDIKFHNGQPVNASAVKFTFDRGANYTKLAKFAMGYLYAPIKEVTVVDEYTVQMELSQASTPLTIYIAGHWASILDPVAITQSGAAYGDTVAIGTGPFKLVEWVKDEKIVLEANKKYWAGAPKLDSIEIHFFSEWSTLKMALDTGEIDMIYAYSYMPTDVPILEESPDIVVVPAGATALRSVLMGCNSFPLNNSLLRQAIAYCIDYDKLVNVAYIGTAVRALSLIPSCFPEYYKPAMSAYTLNVTKAKELLAQAGYADGFSVKLYYTPTHYGPMEPEIAIIIQEGLAKAGIDCEIVSLEWASFLTARKSVSGEMALAGWGCTVTDPDANVAAYVASNGYYGSIAGVANLTWGNLTNALCAEGTITSNKTRRMEIYSELQQIAAQELPVIPYAEVNRYIFYRNDVVGFRPSGICFADDFTHVVKAYIGQP